MRRRHFVRLGAGLTAAAYVRIAAGAAAAESEKVFLDYTQDALDDAFTNAKWAPNMQKHLAGQAAAGARVRLQFPPNTLNYGKKPSERLDVFSPATTTSTLPVMVFLHGGNWRVGSKESVSCIAPTFVNNNVLFVAPDYDPAPANTLPGMVDQCRRAILWVHEHAAQFGADPDRIYIGGHSAGGHLAAVMLTTDWARMGTPPDLLKGGVLLSALCDIQPALMAHRNNHIRLTPKETIEYSPVHKLGAVGCPVIVACGNLDSPEFQRQADVMAQKLRAVGRLAGVLTLQNINHFEILDVMGSDQSRLAAATLALIG